MIKTVKKKKKVKANIEVGPLDPSVKVVGEPARVAAWLVHLYTAIGLMFAAWIAVLLVRGGANAFRWSFLLMVAAGLVDATDGTLARRFRVKAVLPEFDGRKLDDLIDFLTYTCLPLLLVWRAELYPQRVRALVAPPLAGQRLRILPGGSQDRGRLFSRLPLALERRRALPLRVAAQPLVDVRGRLGPGVDDVRADPIPLPVTSGQTQRIQQHHRNPLDHPPERNLVAAPDGPTIRPRRGRPGGSAWPRSTSQLST